jgi:hypothetical protein
MNCNKEELREFALSERVNKIKVYYTKTKNPSAYVNANILHPGKKTSSFQEEE